MTADMTELAVDYDPFSGGALQQVVATTEPQREIWLGDRMGTEASLSFNLSESLRLRGALDEQALRAALAVLVQRHDALRASFGPDGETMCIAEDFELDLPVRDLRPLDPAARGAAVQERLRHQLQTAFNLEQGGLIRFELLRLADRENVLLLTAHHIICDGWSWSVLVRELGMLYGEASGACVAGLPPAESFAEFAQRQQQALDEAGHARDEAYWLGQFPGTPPVLDLPTDHPRPTRRSFASARVDHLLEPGLAAALQRMGAMRGAGVFATLLAGYSILLSRLSGAESVVVGIPAAGQATGGHGALVGHCVNLLPLRFDVDDSRSFAQAIDAAQAVLIDAIEHQQYTLGTLLRRLPIVRTPGRIPLVAAVLNFDQSAGLDPAAFPGLEAELSSNPRSHDAFELFLNIARLADGGLRLECQFNRDCFEPATVRGWLRALQALFEAALESDEQPVSALALVDPSARAALAALQPPALPLDGELRMHEAFERQCDRTPDRVAMACGTVTMTYAALEARANAIAHRLRGEGIAVGDLVGIAIDRNADMLPALLGILKSGAAYVPLDPGFPPDRLAFMVGDAGLAALVTHRSLERTFKLPGKPVLLLDDPGTGLDRLPSVRIGRDRLAARPESPAYVIYTSGSTGRPKGVCVPHRAVANFLVGMAGEVEINEDARLVAVTTLSFDIAVLELLLPLVVGARTVVAPREEAADGLALARLLDRCSATMLQATPATWRMLVEAGWHPPGGFKILCGGESLAPELASELLARSDVVLNLYGPTETTVWSTCSRVLPPTPGAAPEIDIGRPIANTQVWITDRHGQLLPVGVPGEICIGGAGVSLGYLGRPGLTAERFVPDTLGQESAPGALLYRTGDRGRWRADGRLEHLGRLDGQVKIRGFRIELGEVESQALAIPAVTRAVANVSEARAGDARLVLYVVASRPVPQQEVLDHLRARLPEYMLPQHVLQIDALPLLPNGKLDRGALPSPRMQERPDAEPPRNALEAAVVEAMEEVLGFQGIGIHDDFFSLGGHSLLAGQLIARLNRKLGLGLAWRALFDAPTAARLALAIGPIPMGPGDGRATAAPIRRQAHGHRAPLTRAQARLHALEGLSQGRSNFNLPTAHRLSGPMDRPALDRAFAVFAQRHSVLRTVISSHEGVPVQEVLPASGAGSLVTVDLSGLPEGEREAELQRRMDRLTERCFDVASDPPFEARLFRLEPELHVLFFMGHHILWDGWSFQLMADEIAELYAAFHEGRAPVLPDLPVSFGDYARWHAEWVQGPEYAAQRRYWRQQMEGMHDAPGLPHDLPARFGGTGRARVQPLELDEAVVRPLRRNAQQKDATLFMALLGVFFIVLGHWVGGGAVVVGTPVRGRNHADVEHLAGFFTSLLPLRTELRPGLAFSALLGQVRSLVLDGFAHPDVLLEDVMPAPTGRRGQGSNLYHALLSYQNARGRMPAWGNLRQQRISLHPPTTAEDLGLWFVEDDQGLHGELIYNGDVLLPTTVERVSRQFAAVAAEVAKDPSVTVGSLLGMLDEGESADVGAQARAPAPTAAGPAAQRPLETPAEKLLAGLFGELFGIDDVGPEDNFFELGGNSLLALTLIRRIEDATGSRINLIQLASGTVGSLARSLPEDGIQPRAAQGRVSLWRGLFGRSSN